MFALYWGCSGLFTLPVFIKRVASRQNVASHSLQRMALLQCTFYVNCTNMYVIVDKQEEVHGIHNTPPPWMPKVFLGKTIYTSNGPQQLPKMSKLYSICN